MVWGCTYLDLRYGGAELVHFKRSIRDAPMCGSPRNVPAPGPLPPPGTLPPIPDNIESSIGLQLLGLLLNFMLYGILALQIYIYHTSFPLDNRKIKWLDHHERRRGRVQLFRERLAEPGIIPIYTPIMGSVIAFMVQFLDHQAVRVVAVGYYRYGNARFRYASLHVAEHGAILLVKDIQAGLAHNQTLLVYVKPLGTFLWLIGDAIADVLIASVVSLLLLKAKNRQHSQTNDAVLHIVRMTIETNALSTAIAIIRPCSSLQMRRGRYSYALRWKSGRCQSYPLSALLMLMWRSYSNILLLTFNNRDALSRRMDSSDSRSFPSHCTPIWRPAVTFCAGLNPEEFLEDTTPFATEISTWISIIKQSSTMTDSDAITRLDEGGYGGMKVPAAFVQILR
ncbi:hypothetical protein CPB85DRAFT_1258164 [Mucidula mucida]|nr:hypothetical protein CPB85DRAFT_1258164 [Mucidula mucida]